MKIAVFGGSFDPVHIGHKAVVDTALKNLDIDKLIVVPTFLNPFKDKFFFEPKDRFNLLQKVFSSYEKVELSDYEINKQKPCYSYDTVVYLSKLYVTSKVYFIIGEDNLQSLHKWHKIDELKSVVEFVVAKRSNLSSQILKDYKVLDIDVKISSTNLRESLNLDFIPDEIKDDILKLQKKEKIEQ